MTTRITFAGAGAGPLPLTWGQQAIWAAIARTAPNDHYFNLARTLPVPPSARPLAVATAVAAVGAVMSRHASLRSRIVGERQHVDGAGSLLATVVHACEADADAAAAALSERLSTPRFRYHEEYPLRVGLVVVGGGPAGGGLAGDGPAGGGLAGDGSAADGSAGGGSVHAIVLALSHLATDGYAAEIVVRDLRLALIGRTGPRPGDLVTMVTWQQSVSGRRRSDAVVDAWAEAYRRLPVSMFPTQRARPRPVRFWVARLRSPALALACRLLVARYRVSTTAMLMAATAAVVSAESGEATVAMLPIVGNRVAPEHRDLVTTMSQEGLFVLDVTGSATVEDLFAPAWRASLRAYRTGMYDQVSMDETLERVRAERGEPVHPYCCFNDMRMADHAALGAMPSPERIRALRPATTLTWAPPQTRVSCRFCLHVRADGDALVVSLTADTGYLPPPRMMAALSAMETLLLDATERDTARRTLALADLPALLAAGREQA